MLDRILTPGAASATLVGPQQLKEAFWSAAPLAATAHRGVGNMLGGRVQRGLSPWGRKESIAGRPGSSQPPQLSEKEASIAHLT